MHSFSCCETSTQHSRAMAGDEELAARTSSQAF
jgi:hypothetical protein